MPFIYDYESTTTPRGSPQVAEYQRNIPLPAPTPPPAVHNLEPNSDSSHFIGHQSRDRKNMNRQFAYRRPRWQPPRITYHDLPPNHPAWPPGPLNEANSELRTGSENVHVYYYARSTPDYPICAGTRYPRPQHQSAPPGSQSRFREDVRGSQREEARPASQRRDRSSTPSHRHREEPISVTQAPRHSEAQRSNVHDDTQFRRRYRTRNSSRRSSYSTSSSSRSEARQSSTRNRRPTVRHVRFATLPPRHSIPEVEVDPSTGRHFIPTRPPHRMPQSRRSASTVRFTLPIRTARQGLGGHGSRVNTAVPPVSGYQDRYR